MLNNKTIILTGASKGIGKALAINLASQGVNLVLVARSQSKLAEVKNQVEQAGSNCLIFAGSVSNESLVNKVVSETLATFGQIDFMINNAGFGVFKRASDISSEEWDSIYDTNCINEYERGQIGSYNQCCF